MSRKRIFEIIEKADGNDRASFIYDVAMIIVIIISLIQLVFKVEGDILRFTDKVTAVIFIVDYFFRWITADYKFRRRNAFSFIRYPFSIMAIIDLVSILPSLSIINNAFRTLRVFRMMRAMRVFRVFKVFRYSKSIRIIGNVLRASRDSLIAVCLLAVGYILVSALVIFNVEPDSFRTFFDAVYWATVSLTTVGYGDIYPVSTMGRIITMISSVFGIAIVALPAGIITAEYITELRKEKERKEKKENDYDDEELSN